MVVAFKSVSDEIMNYCLFVWSRREQAKVFDQYSTSGAGAFKSVTDEIMNYCLFVWSRREQAKVFGQNSTSGAGADISSESYGENWKIPVSPFTALCIWLLFYVLKLKSLK